MNELQLIEAIRRWTGATQNTGLIAGIGDDCAIVRPLPREDLLITTDLLIEDVHFRRDAMTASRIGAKAIARGLSDIAAMGGAARHALLSVALAPWTSMQFMRDFYRGVMRLARRFDAGVIGGDVSRGEMFTCDVVVMGAVPKGKALRRDGARPGDAIYVSGPLGAAAASGWTRAVEPRLDLAEPLRRLRATACMDLSDGLSLDLHRLCIASGVAASLDRGAIPVARGATDEQALHGGEDYELLVTLSPRARVPAALKLTRIGVIAEGKPGRVTLDGKALSPRGWDPFRG